MKDTSRILSSLGLFFLSSTNKRLFPLCECGAVNKEGHAADECTKKISKEKRIELRESFERLHREAGLEMKKSLHECLRFIFFELEPGLIKKAKKPKKIMRELVLLMKKMITLMLIREKEAKSEEEFNS